MGRGEMRHCGGRRSAGTRWAGALPAEAPVPSIDVLRRFMDSRAQLTSYWLAATRGEALFAASLALGLLQLLLLLHPLRSAVACGEALAAQPLGRRR